MPNPLSLCQKNMAKSNIRDTSHWYADIEAARDEDEAVANECHEAKAKFGMPEILGTLGNPM